MTLHDLMNWEKAFSVPVLKSNTSNPFLMLQKEMNQLFDHLSKGVEVYTTDWDKKGISTPAVNVIENKNHFRVEAELPGLDPENLDVSITKESLVIKGEKKEEKKEEDENYLRHETSYDSFYRHLPLPQTADSNKAEASFKNGVLTIKIQKKADAIHKPRKLEIKKAA
ncbi:MAG: Hsp20/alpha crystallin family protein [Alphaproteobacteria bacterium]|nr:Hsp20/alpha crystallin family protein [Alphaproteobacteria bacterium]